VVLRENKALLIRQVKGASLEGQWSIPWGIVETEEFPSSAAVRETLEEGGVTAEIEGLLGIQNLSWENSIGIIYLCRHVAGEPLADGGVETDQAAYLSLDEIEELNEPIEPWCEWIVKRVLRNEHHLIPSEPNNPYQPKPAFL
jgi:ADP-ribose pyrophosphatase YjhB (NUDIX family)